MAMATGSQEGASVRVARKQGFQDKKRGNIVALEHLSLEDT